MTSINTPREWETGDNGNVRYDDVVISFDTRENENDGFYELLLKRVPVRSAGQHKYVVNPLGLQILNSKNIKYKIE